MNFCLKSSLQCLALTKIAVALWNQYDVKAPAEMTDRVWLEAEYQVIEKVPRLLIPNPLKEKVKEFVSGIGWEIFESRQQFHQKYHIDQVLLSELCWTPHGTIDRKKTAEVLIKNEKIDITCRHSLACDYCLEDYIIKLWDKMPENLREIQKTKNIKCWGMELSPCEHAIQTGDYLFGFRKAIGCGNEAATEYFLQRLTHEQKKLSLVTSAKTLIGNGSSYQPHYPKVLCSLISQMDQCEQLEIFKYNPLDVLRSLLKWPFQNLFVEAAIHMWDFLSERAFHICLRKIILKVKSCYRDYDYGKLFWKFWEQSPNAYRNMLMKKLNTGEPLLFGPLFETKDKQNVTNVLKSATVEERRYTLLNISLIFVSFVKTDKLYFVKHCLQKFLPSKEEIINFKKEFKKQIECRKLASPGMYEERKCELDKFVQFLDFIQNNNNKRSTEEACESTAKRPHSTES